MKKIKKQIKWLLILCLGGVLACGGMTNPVGKEFDTSKAASLVKGKTTTSQVLEYFGLPMEIRKINHNGIKNEVWYYRYYSENIDQTLEITLENQVVKDFKLSDNSPSDG